MRLAAAGMRLASVDTAIRHNPTCEVDAFSRLYAQPAAQAAGRELPRLNFNVEAILAP